MRGPGDFDSIRKSPSLFRRFDLHLSREIGAGDRAGIGEQILDLAAGEDFPAVLARSRTHVDDLVGGEDRVDIVLDDEDGVPLVPQAEERLDQLMVVGRVKADRRLVEDVDRADEPRADLGGEPDPLRFAAAQRRRGPVEREIRKADVDQKLEPLFDLLQKFGGDRRLGGREFQRFEEDETIGERQRRQLGDLFPPEPRLRRVGFDPRAIAGRADPLHH